MTENHTKDDSKSDDGEESDRELKATAKAYALLVYAYLRAGVGRILDEFAKAADEIAPQLTGALSGVSIPARAWKPLGLAAVLLIAAVAIPAAPLGDDPSASVETQEPVEGETFETETEPETDSETSTEPERSTLNGATLNELPSSFLDSPPDAPEPPQNVRASAGSQTMNVETAGVDGEPAIVLEDDRTHDGRWVSIETAWFEEHLGEIPNAAYVTHEDGSRYAAALNVRGESAAFYVREFSTNTVTFDGEVTLSGEEAGDGTEFQYDLNATDVGAPSINLTGVETTQADSVSARRTDGESLGFSVGGGSEPSDETVMLTGIEETNTRQIEYTTTGTVDPSISGNVDPDPTTVTIEGNGFGSRTVSDSVTTVSDGYSTSVNLQGSLTDTAQSATPTVELTGVTNTAQESASAVLSNNQELSLNPQGSGSPTSETIQFEGRSTTSTKTVSGTTDRSSDVSLSVQGNQNPKNAVLTVSNTKNRDSHTTTDGSHLYQESYTWSFSQSADIDRIGLDHREISSASADGAEIKVYVNGGQVAHRTVSNQGGDTEYIDISPQHVNDVKVEHISGSSMTIDSVDVREVAETDVSATIDGQTYNFGSGGQKSVDLSASTSTIDFTAELSNSFDYSLEYDAVTKTENPSVSIGGSTVASYTGTLNQGETVSEQVELSLGSQTATTSVSGEVEVTASWTERTQTTSPVVELNGETSSYSGTLSDGETTTLSFPDDSLNAGSNTISLSLPSISGPAHEADLNYEFEELDGSLSPEVDTDGDGTAEVSSSAVLTTGETVSQPVDHSVGDTWTISASGNAPTVSSQLTERTVTQDVSVAVGGSTVSHTGILDNGQTVTESVDLSTGSQTATVSVNGPVDVNASWTEVTETQDPTITVNGESTGISGTLADGETATLDASASWLQSGTNYVTVSTNSPMSGPASLVTLDYSHGAETATEATVEETTWSQTTTVANTWASARSNASVTVPMNDRVVDVRSVEVRRNGTTWDPLAADRYELNGTDLTAELGDIAEGSMVEVRATGSKVRVRDGSITVLEPTMSSDQLDTRVRIDDAGPNFALSVDETVFSDRVHYADNSTWGPQTGATTITAQGDQTLAIPNATVGAQTTVRTWPVEVAPVTGQATVTDLAGDRSEPGITVRGDGNSDVDYTFTGAADGRPYILWSQTNEIVRDEGLASSPITLTDDNSDETLVFLVDDGSASSSGPGDGPTGSVGGGGAGGGPMAGAGGSVLAQLRGIAPSGQTLLLGVTLLGGLFVVGRRTGVITEDRQQAATSAAGSAASTVGGLVERAIANEIVFGVLLLAGGGWLLASGVLPEQTTLIVSLSAVPVAMFLVLQQFDRFDFRIWAGSTALVGVLGLQVLAPELFETIADEAGVIIVAGVLALAWRAVSAWRAEANTPDEVNRIEITDDDGEN
ncbi:hypothetical protein [Halorubrum ezzemoulense]|uniref:hypothetical protein n=1 Tax=Halorubrum ezzemoulense TaxID=337243 RepID=UPI00117AFD9D|nr:hypothetical protein [Halorubrum ezzemoulense]